MYITPITDEYEPFGSGLPRSPGLHLTQIIRSLQEDLGLAKKAEGWEMHVCADIGFLWEEAFSIAYREKNQQFPIMRPGEIVVEGIAMSPDGVGADPLEELALVDHELKCTWRSSTKSPADDFYWDTQFKCYCRAVGTTVTVLHVIYLNGNYRGSGPQWRNYRIEYDQKEIDTAWGMVKRHAEEKGWLK